jgi:hypothetical protein
MVDTKGRIWQLKLLEVLETKLVGVRYGEALLG